MSPSLWSISVLLVAALGPATGCGTWADAVHAQSKSSTGKPPRDHPGLLARLRALGAGAAVVGEADQPFLSVTGRMIKVHGEDVQVFQYVSAAAADAETAPISRDGRTVGTRKIHWIGSPHFFKNGKLLVLYVGDSERVIGSLEAMLGQQFAGP